MSIYLKNTIFIDWKTLEFRSSNLKVTDGINGSLEFIDSVPVIQSGKDQVLDCKNKIVTKSFACGHHHIYSALSRGMPKPKKDPRNFLEILQFIWWNLDKCLDMEMIVASALFTAMECAKNGVTFIIDHHSSPFCVENSLNTIAEACDKVGISHLLCYEISERDGTQSKEKGLEETERYLKEGKQGLVGLHASFTVSDDLLDKAVKLAQKYNSGIHIHTAEDMIDQEECMKNYKKRIIERFNAKGVLDFKKTILAHCLHLNEIEKGILRNSVVSIVENVESNLNNRVGYFNSEKLDLSIMLGTDGMHSDMLRSAKMAYLMGKQIENIDIMTIYRRFRNVHNYLFTNGFSGDGENNLVIFNYDTPTEINQDNFLGHLIFGIESSHIESVISKGKLIVHNRKLLTVDENEILTFSREMGRRLWEKMK